MAIELGSHLIEDLELLVKKHQEICQTYPSWINRLDSKGLILDWFKWFINTPKFQETYCQAGQYLLTPRTDEEVHTLTEHIAGWLFESIAFTNKSSNLEPGLVLLPSESTFQFYHKLFPDTEVKTNLLGHKSLAGVSDPDGLLVDTRDKTNILGIIEYTLSKDGGYFGRKTQAHEADRLAYPFLFRNTNIFFITPRFESLPSDVAPYLRRIRQLPFTHKQFGHFFNAMYDYYRPHQGLYSPDAASLSLKEVQKKREHRE